MGMDLAEGSKAPAFKLPRGGGGSLSLADFKGRTLVLFLPQGRISIPRPTPRLHPGSH